MGDLDLMPRRGWKFDPSSDFYLWGDKVNGAGVSSDDGCKTFYVNVVYDGGVILYPSYLTLEEAMEVAEAGWNEIHKNYRDS